MIQAVLVFNNWGKPRLMKFYTHMSDHEQQEILSEIYNLLSQRTDESFCNFIDKASFIGNNQKIMYRHFTTLYFVFCCDDTESELAILDLIQVFVEALDKCFKNVCELDLIFHADKAHLLLDEIIMGGVVLETDIEEVIARYQEKLKLEAKEKRATPEVSFPALPNLPSFTDFKLKNMSVSDVEFMRI